MSSYMVNANNPLAASVWSKRVTAEALRESFFDRFIGKDASGNRLSENDAGAMITMIDDLQSNKGDNVTVSLRAQLQGDGVTGHDTLEGNEESLVFRKDTIVINELAHAVSHNERITKQRTITNQRKEGKAALRDWWAETWDQTLINHLAGNTLYTGNRFRGNNQIKAPTHLLLANSGSNSTETAVGTDSTATPTLARFLAMANYARINNIRPVSTSKGKFYIVFLHDETMHTLRVATGAGTFQDIYKANLQGGRIDDNPIFTGADFIYENMIFYQTNRLPRGINVAGTAGVANTRRAVLCGAQAASVAFGMDNDKNRLTYKEEPKDYQREIGIAMSSIYGLKKCRFTGFDANQDADASTDRDFATVVACFYSTSIASQI